MAYRVVFRRSALRELERLPQPIRHRVATAINLLASDPRPSGAKLLHGSGGRWRVRVGEYRILYVIEDERVTVVVIRIRHRSDAYR